ncbi:MAG: Uma2 family endonuclease [Blastocatellia bacterium]
MAVIDLQTKPDRTTEQRSDVHEIPPLRQGDYLTRAEFERRYEAMPEVNKAELIEGRVYMPSPVRAKGHGAPHGDIVGWLVHYKAFTPGVSFFDNSTTRLDQDNEPQPDAQLRIDEALGGQPQISDDDYIEGAPELAAEVASSSAPFDLNQKKEAYRRNGVQEYIVWQTPDRRIDWFGLADGQYAPLLPDADGIIRSRVFPGLWLDVEALLKDDMAKVLAVLQQGLASPEHGDFVKRLSEARQ